MLGYLLKSFLGGALLGRLFAFANALAHDLAVYFHFDLKHFSMVGSMYFFGHILGCGVAIGLCPFLQLRFRILVFMQFNDFLDRYPPVMVS